jgi:hypothetical protein
MPIHDWTRVDAGVFHDFHVAWVAALRGALNSGVLPPDYYAMAEQHAGKYVPDVLTLNAGRRDRETEGRRNGVGLALAEAPPRVQRHLSLSPVARTRRRTLAIRHVSGDRLVALIEIVSPANKDRKQSVEDLLTKLEDALVHGINLLIIDLLPPTKRDPYGIHGALWDRLGDDPEKPPKDRPLTLASYVGHPTVEAYVEHLAVGSVLPDMPLFLEPDYYVNTPLEATYQETWHGTAYRYRDLLESPTKASGSRRKK